MSRAEQLQTLAKTVNSLSGSFISAALNYERKISGPHCRDIYLLRDSLSDRLSAVLFHVELLIEFQDHAEYVVQNAEPDIFLPTFVDRHQRKSQHLFDDLVFNLMSLFDYVSNFAGYIFYGDQIRARAKGYDPLNTRTDNSHDFKHLRDVLESLRWSYVAEVADLSRIRGQLGNLKGNLLKGTRTGEQIARWDKELVSSLRIYRNDVIHNWADPTSGGFSISTGNPANNTVTVNPPYRFQRDFRL